MIKSTQMLFDPAVHLVKKFYYFPSQFYKSLICALLKNFPLRRAAQ